MDRLPVELLRLIYSFCDHSSVKNLRLVSPLLAHVSYEYLMPSDFRVVSWRNDIDRLHSVALHERLRGSIEAVCVYLGELAYYDATLNPWGHYHVREALNRENILRPAWSEYQKKEEARRAVGPLHLKADDLREACSALPNLRDFEVTFNQSPFENDVLQGVFREPSCRKLDRPETYSNLDAIIFALHGIRLSSFKIDRLPLELFRQSDHRRHWFTHAQSFQSLSTLHLTLDPSGLRGPGSAMRAVNGLGGLLTLATGVRRLKLAFHPYNNGETKFIICFRELLGGFVYKNLSELMLEGVSCDEDDLRDFLSRHGETLVRLRLGGRGLAKSIQASRGGIHLHDGTFKSLFTGLRMKLPHLERLHLEGIFECEHPDLPTHEAYNFYPLTDDEWEAVPCPSWVRTERSTIDCLPFEHYVLHGGPYPSNTWMQ